MKLSLSMFAAAACLAASLSCAPVVQAQAAGGAAKMQALSKQLGLTPQQKTELAPVLMAEAPKLQALKSNTSMPPMQKLQAMRAIHAESDPKVKSILTPAQYQKFQTIRQNEIRQAMAKKRA